MDDVMAETGLKILKTYNELFKTDHNPADFTGKPFDSIFDVHKYGVVREEIRKPGFFADLEVKPDAPQVIEALNAVYDVYIVSAATEFPLSLSEKISWLNKNFPYIGWQKMVFCGYKHMINANIMIDDHTKNLDYFEGETKLLFNALHNQDVLTYKRVNSWSEIAEILL